MVKLLTDDHVTMTATLCCDGLMMVQNDKGNMKKAEKKKKSIKKKDFNKLFKQADVQWCPVDHCSSQYVGWEVNWMMSVVKI